MKFFGFVVLLIALPLLSWSQSTPSNDIALSGVIVNETGEALPFVTITNLATQTGVVSDEEGFFFINFDKKDTLRLSSVGYQSYQLYFGDTAQANNYDLKIRLSEQTYQLENVTIFAFKDEESFKRAILAMDDLPPEEPKIVVPGSYQGPRRKVRPSPANPISFIFDRFSKRARYEREAYKAQQAYAHQKVLDKKYNRDKVGKITGLTDEKLDRFMLFCQVENDYIERSSEYDIILTINHCYEDFQKTQN